MDKVEFIGSLRVQNRTSARITCIEITSFYFFFLFSLLFFFYFSRISRIFPYFFRIFSYFFVLKIQKNWSQQIRRWSYLVNRLDNSQRGQRSAGWSGQTGRLRESRIRVLLDAQICLGPKRCRSPWGINSLFQIFFFNFFFSFSVFFYSLSLGKRSSPFFLNLRWMDHRVLKGSSKSLQPLFSKNLGGFPQN